MVNEALAKAAEEITKGLAKEAPLKTTDRSKTNTGGAARQDTFALFLTELMEISEDHFWSAFAIGLGWSLRDNPALLKSAQRMWGRTGGMSLSEAQDHLIEIESKFNTWWKYTTINRMIDGRQYAIGITGEGRTYEDMAFPKGIDYRTVKSRAHKAVDCYVGLNKKTGVPKPISKKQPREKRMLNVSRIIHFLD